MTQDKLKHAVANKALLLVAYSGPDIIGFKMGYQIQGQATFFSWLGGIVPEFRRRGLAQHLLLLQEQHARDLGLANIYFTTYDRFPAMIALGKKNGYELEKSELDGNQTKYWYVKSLHNFNTKWSPPA